MNAVMSRDADRLVPDFSLKSLACFVGVLTIVAFAAILVLALLCKWKDIVSCLVRPISLGYMIQSVSSIATVLIWPLFVLLVLFIFRDNLGLAVDAVTGMLKALNGVDEIKVWKEDHGVRSSESSSASDMTVRLNTEIGVLDFLQRKINRPIMRDVQLFGMNFRFDGVYQDSNRFVGIEVKTRGPVSEIQNTVYAINAEFIKLKRRDKRRFSLLLYVPESEFGQCKQWICNLDFRISVVTSTNSGEMLLR